MIVLLTPTSLRHYRTQGVGQDGGTLIILSKCCTEPVTDKDETSGKQVWCSKCDRVFSAPKHDATPSAHWNYKLEYYYSTKVIVRWVKAWTGFTVTVEISE